MMTPMDDLEKAVVTLDKRFGAVFGVACAQPLVPLCDQFASAKSSKVVHRVLDGFWKTAAANSRKAVDAYIGCLGLLPEAKCADYYDPRFYAMTAIGITIDGLRCAKAKARASERMLVVCRSAFDLANNLDAELDPALGRTRWIDPFAESEEDIGELAKKEIAFQHDVVLLLKQNNDLTADIIGQIMRLAARMQKSILRAARRIGKRQTQQ